MYTFIVNPNAKTGLGYQVWSSLEAILKEKNVIIKYFLPNIKSTPHASRRNSLRKAGQKL